MGTTQDAADPLGNLNHIAATPGLIDDEAILGIQHAQEVQHGGEEAADHRLASLVMRAVRSIVASNGASATDRGEPEGALHDAEKLMSSIRAAWPRLEAGSAQRRAYARAYVVSSHAIDGALDRGAATGNEHAIRELITGITNAADLDPLVQRILSVRVDETDPMVIASLADLSRILRRVERMATATGRAASAATNMLMRMATAASITAVLVMEHPDLRERAAGIVRSITELVRGS
jgi:hypothetical protein